MLKKPKMGFCLLKVKIFDYQTYNPTSGYLNSVMVDQTNAFLNGTSLEYLNRNNNHIVKTVLMSLITNPHISTGYFFRSVALF